MKSLLLISLISAFNLFLIENIVFSQQGVEIEIYYAGRVVDKEIGIPVNAASLQVVAKVPFDSTGQHSSPRLVASGSASLMSGGTVRLVIPFNANQVDLRRISSQARSGDHLVIELSEVIQRNYDGTIDRLGGYERYHLFIYR